MSLFRRVLRKGQGLVEYALILVLVAIVAIGILAAAGRGIQNVFCDIVLSLGGSAPDIGACAAPRITLVGISDGAVVTGDISVEAVIQDNKGGKNPNISKVTFTMDGTKVNDEGQYKFCLHGGDATCDQYTPTVGTHTLNVKAWDVDGNTGEVTITFRR